MDQSNLVIFAAFVVSMLIVGRLARDAGRKSLPWVVTASVIGPFAIALLYLADATAALWKMMNAPRHSP